MLNKKIEDAFNLQFNAEAYSAYLYLSMAAWFESRNLPGFAMWLKVQAQEEMTHALRFYNFIHARGGRVTLTAIETPPAEWNSPLQVFEETYKHEQKVTGLINNLVDLSQQEHDHASDVFLQWFVNEQVEEESNASKTVEKLKLAKDNPSALLMLDTEMGTRVFLVPPVLAPTIGFGGLGAAGAAA